MAINWSVVTWEPQFSILFFNSYCPSSEAPRLLLVLAAPGLIMLNCWWPLSSQQVFSGFYKYSLVLVLLPRPGLWTLLSASKSWPSVYCLISLTQATHHNHKNMQISHFCHFHDARRIVAHLVERDCHERNVLDPERLMIPMAMMSTYSLHFLQSSAICVIKVVTRRPRQPPPPYQAAQSG